MNNFEMMRRRLEVQGGIHQEERMIKDKYRSFQRALKYSYQAASVSMVQRWNECISATPAAEAKGEQIEPIEDAIRVLINPDRVKQDYDDKIISIGYEHGWGPGDVFKWRGNDTCWIIYLEELTEDAYFRGAIRRCKYRIKFKDQEGSWQSTWAAIRGPVETQIDSIQKNQVRIDRPNLSLNILLPRNPQTLYAFERYKEFLFAGRSWQVKAPDSISMRNIIEVAAEEYYIDKATDDVENEMKNGLVVEPFDPTPGIISGIYGNAFIKPTIEEIYNVEEDGGTWGIKAPQGINCLPIVSATSRDGKRFKVKWKGANSFAPGFEITWDKENKHLVKKVVVESLF